jgi:hypothetical protein
MVTLAAEMLELLVTIHPVIDERGQNSMPVHQSCVAGMALPVPIEAVLHERVSLHTTRRLRAVTYTASPCLLQRNS